MSPITALWLANALLLLHLGVVLFAVGLLPLVLIGSARGWRWVRNRRLRGLQAYALLSASAAPAARPTAAVRDQPRCS